MSSPPPPPRKKENRRHPRYELFASVEITRGDETLILPARNLSLGGVSLAADGNDLSRFAVGAEVSVDVFDLSDETRPPVRAPAVVLRHERGAVALMWRGEDPRVARDLALLLEVLKPQKR
jgi:hypothetical protein